MAIFSKLKQFKDMRENAKRAQNILGAEQIEGNGAHGRVKVTMSGTFEVKGVAVADDIVGKKLELEGAIKDAFNDGVKKVQMVLFRKRNELKDLQG